ncbi:MAG: YfhO family protein [Chloroflexi bacterium]|nr:YfhO family protein [Chloroflexota bacterium]
MRVLSSEYKPATITLRETLRAGALLIILITLFFAPAIIKGEVLLPTDLIFDVDPLWQSMAPVNYMQPGNALLTDQVYQFYPWEVFTRHAFSQGTLPLWNPYTNSGQPFIGNALSGVFGPFNVAGYLFSLNASFLIEAALRLFTAGIFTFLLARQIGVGKMGALLAMIIFTFSSPMTGWIGYPVSSVVVWLPGILFATERALTGKSSLYLLLGGAMIGMQFLSGQPEISFQIMLIWGLYALFRATSLYGWQVAKLKAPLLKLGGMAVTGIFLGSVQLLPFIESLFYSGTFSARQVEAAQQQTAWLQTVFLDWQDWGSIITMVLPQYFGTPLNNSYWFPYNNYLEATAYAGILPLALAIAATLYAFRNPHAAQRPLLLFFAAVGIFSLGIALHFPLFNALNQLPLFDIAANGRFRLIYTLMIALTAGFGLDYLLAKKPRLNKRVWQALILFSVGSLLLIIVTYAGFTYFKDEFIQRGFAFVEAKANTPHLAHPLEYYYQEIVARQERKLALFLPTNLTMYIPLLTVGGYALLHDTNKKSKRAQAITGWFILAIVTADLFLVNIPFNPTTPPEQIYPTPDAIAYLQQTDGIFRINGTNLILNPNSNMVFGLADVRGYDPITPKRYQDLLNQLEGYFPIHHHSLFVTAVAPLLDMMNTQYLLSDQPQGAKWEPVFQGEGNVVLYRNRQALPRAYIVYQAEISADAAQSLARISDPAFNFREKVILEGLPSDWQLPETDSPLREVSIIEYRPNQISLTTSTPDEGVLVLTDSYMPGWKAYIDGQETPLYIANHAFRGIIIPAGDHQVGFVYRPVWFWLGAGLSGLTLALLIVWLSILLFRRRSV